MKEPTAKMIEVLRELAKPDVIADYMPYMGRFNQSAYYYLSSNWKRCTAQIASLKKRGLAEQSGDRVRITEAGREFLKREKAK